MFAGGCRTLRLNRTLKAKLVLTFHLVLVRFIHPTSRDGVMVLASRSLYTLTTYVFYVVSSAVVVSIANLYAVYIYGEYKDNFNGECSVEM